LRNVKVETVYNHSSISRLEISLGFNSESESPSSPLGGIPSRETYAVQIAEAIVGQFLAVNCSRIIPTQRNDTREAATGEALYSLFPLACLNSVLSAKRD